MNLESMFTFGAHKGEQVEDVIMDDRQYVLWLIEEKDFAFDEDVLEELEKTRDKF